MAGAAVVSLGGSPVRVITDTRQLQRFIGRLTNERMPREFRRHMIEVGAPAANAYRANIPARSTRPSRTGDLRKSVRYKVFFKRAPSRVGVVVAPMGRLGAHRHLVEYGTRPHMPPVTADRGFESIATNMGIAGRQARGVGFGIARRIEREGTAPAPYAAAARAAAEPRMRRGLDQALQRAIDQSGG